MYALQFLILFIIIIKIRPGYLRWMNIIYIVPVIMLNQILYIYKPNIEIYRRSFQY